MKKQISNYKITLPIEFREKAGFPRNGFVDVTYDEATGNFIISSKLKSDYETETPKKEAVVKKKAKKETKKETEKKIKKTTKPRKIEANFMNADKLYKAYYSECGLVVRTKNRYVNDFCEDCKGQLAKEWEDRAEVKCKYLTVNLDCKQEELDRIKEEVVQEAVQEPVQEIIQEPVQNSNPITELRKKRKKDIEHISKSIKEANKVIDKEIETLEQKQKRGRPKKQKRYSTGSTILKPVNTGNEKFLNCSECGQFVGSGFYLDDEFLCKECAVSDFKEYLKRRGN